MLKEKVFPYSWDEAIEILRNDPKYTKLIYDAYLTRDLIQNVERFNNSLEFEETKNLIRKFNINAFAILDIPAGNGIATYAFAKLGFRVTAVEPDNSPSLGRKAIEFVLNNSYLNADIVNAYGEKLPFENNTFDVVYVRQGLHHANDLRKMVMEFYRLLKPGGIMIACREHVVNNRKNSLSRFLQSQADHLLYGGENAFTLREYSSAIKSAGFRMESMLGPYASVINLHPFTPRSLSKAILKTRIGKALSLFISARIVVNLGVFILRVSRRPGRLFTFVARK